jgi:hypothetical protein
MIFSFVKDERGRRGFLGTYVRMFIMVCVNALMPFCKAVINVFVTQSGLGQREGHFPARLLQGEPDGDARASESEGWGVILCATW